MKEFWIRVVSVLAVVGILVSYDVVLQAREKDDEIARLSAELASTQNTAGLTEEDGASGYEDGTYTGEAQGFGGIVAVEVEIEGGEIKDIQITSAENEDGAYLAMAEDIIPNIIEAQSTEVDTISGATFSSTGIRDAVALALGEAGQ